MNEDAGLFADILEHPRDDTPRLIYADWLEDRADPGDAARAAFIRLQIQIARGATPDLLRREKSMLTQYGRQWSRGCRPALSRLAWRRGFVDAATVSTATFLNAPDQILALAPLRRLRFRDPAGHLATLCRCPHLGRLDGISFAQGRLTRDDLQTLLSSPYTETLRELDLAGNEVSPSGVRHFRDRMPALASLGLAGVRLGHIGLSEVITGLPLRLVALDLEANGLDDRCLGLLDRYGQQVRRLAVGRNRFTVDGLNHLLSALPGLECLSAGRQPRAVREQLTKDYPAVTFDFGHAGGMGA